VRAPGAITALVVVLALSACAAEPRPLPTDSGSTAPPAPGGTPTTTAGPILTLNPNGSAADNLAYFDQVNQASIALQGPATGKVMTEGLVRAGFDKTTMQVTADRTAIGLDADSVQFSVVYAGECLIGQVGSGGYTSVVLPTLADGKCLVGKTREITW
jgi:hypothetical protein